MELINQTANNKKVDAGNTIRLQDIYRLFINNWYWFVLSLLITVGATVAYLLVTPSVYTRSASILIKDDGKGGGISGSEGNAFADLGMFKVKTNVNNEMISLKSPAVIQEVVRRLHLNVNYQSDGRFHRETLYGTSLPVTVDFKNLSDNDAISLTLQLPSAQKVVVTDIRLNGQEVSGAYEAKIGKTIKTPIGQLTVTATNYYGKGQHNEIYVSRSGILNGVALCTGNLTVMQNDEASTIIDLSYNDVNIQRAEDVLNMLISVYNENWVKDKNQIAVSTSQFIDERLEVIEKELGNVDNDISSYKSKHLLPDVQAASSMYMAQASEASAQIQQLNNQLYTARYLRNIVGRDNNGYQLLPANIGSSTPAIDRDVNEYNDLVLQYNNLASSSSTDNPVVMEKENNLKALKSSILHSIDNQINALNTQLMSSQSTKSQSTAQIASNPGQAKYLLSVERQQKVKESLYLFLLQKREENELSQAFTAYNTRIITPPTGSLAPTAPVRRNMLLISLLLGLAIPAIILFLKENMNTTVRGRKDIEQMTIPFVGEIPLYGHRGKLKNKKKEQAEEHSTILVKQKSRNLINEAFRVVRSNMEFMAGSDCGQKVVMLTSVNPGSGKTFLTINLAASFAIKERRVIAIDLDMRRASLSQYAGKPSLGVANYLNEGVRDWHTVVVRDENNAYLDILPVGPIPPNPAELLYSPRLQKMIEELREQYDMIFIDCPPYEVVADTSIVSKWADLTIFVIRAGLLEREMLPVIEEYYTEKKFHNMSILLNGTTSASGRYGYHRYGYHYGYGYGYHEEDK